jgi:hypothetical protein
MSEAVNVILTLASQTHANPVTLVIIVLIGAIVRIAGKAPAIIVAWGQARAQIIAAHRGRPPPQSETVITQKGFASRIANSPNDGSASAHGDLVQIVRTAAEEKSPEGVA